MCPILPTSRVLGLYLVQLRRKLFRHVVDYIRSLDDLVVTIIFPPSNVGLVSYLLWFRQLWGRGRGGHLAPRHHPAHPHAFRTKESALKARGWSLSCPTQGAGKGGGT